MLLFFKPVHRYQNWIDNSVPGPEHFSCLCHEFHLILIKNKWQTSCNRKTPLQTRFGTGPDPFRLLDFSFWSEHHRTLLGGSRFRGGMLRSDIACVEAKNANRKTPKGRQQAVIITCETVCWPQGGVLTSRDLTPVRCSSVVWNTERQL